MNQSIAGKEDYDRLRPLSYPMTDMFLYCFSVISRDSLYNLKHKWLPEVKHHGYDKVPYIIIGTKCDLRKQKQAKENFERMEYHHATVIDYMLRVSAGSGTDTGSESDSFADYPSDLIGLILNFSKYTRDEVDYDERIVDLLIDENEINEAISGDLKYGFYEFREKAPYIETSALTQEHLLEMLHMIMDLHIEYTAAQEAKTSGKKCFVM